MSAPRKNLNAIKAADERAESFLHVRCRSADKGAWVRAANARSKREPEAKAGLASWVVDALNAASRHSS